MIASGIVRQVARPVSRGVVPSSGGGGAPWGGLTNIVGMWPFDEASGPALDASGNGYNLTAFNTPGYNATGGPGGIACRTSVGSGQYFAIASIDNFAAGDFTFVAWDYWNAGVFDSRTMGSPTPGFEVILGHLNDVSGGRYVDNDSPAYRSYACTSGTWHSKIMRITRASKRCEVFVDGVSVLDVTMANNINAIANGIEFMAGASQACRIACLAVTKYLFTDADVAAFSASARNWAYWQGYSP